MEPTLPNVSNLKHLMRKADRLATNFTGFPTTVLMHLIWKSTWPSTKPLVETHQAAARCLPTTTWEHFAAKYINKHQVQQNYIVKIITISLFFKMKLNPLYEKLNLLILSNIYKLEILKLMSKYENNSLPNCFKDFIALPSKLHYYPTRFATGDNYSIGQFDKSNTQRFIRYQGPVVWNELPAKIKNSARKNTSNISSNV